VDELDRRAGRPQRFCAIESMAHSSAKRCSARPSPPRTPKAGLAALAEFDDACLAAL